MSQNPKAYPTYSERIFSAGDATDYLFCQRLPGDHVGYTRFNFGRWLCPVGTAAGYRHTES